MTYLNQVYLIGHLTKAPECRYTAGGKAIGGFCLAVNRRYRVKSGEEREETCFLDIELVGRHVEYVRHNLGKGSLAYVEGRLRLVEWQDKKSGTTRSRLKITAHDIIALPSPESASQLPRSAIIG